MTRKRETSVKTKKGRKATGAAKAWKGRIQGATDPVFEAYNRSLDTDLVMAEWDVFQTRNWAAALAGVGVLSDRELQTVQTVLDEIEVDLENEADIFLPSDEDIHMAIERRITKRTRSAGGKMQTGRSRNDQVITDLRLTLKDRLEEIDAVLASFQEALIERAADHTETVLPGYTHLQPAQIISLAHYLLSFFWALDRDRERIRDAITRIDVMPLGSGALAGTGFPVDRNELAERLGFSRPSSNSLDTVSDRDFVAETAFVLAQTMTHLSRYAEDWILWSNPSFGFVRLDDSLSTGSSLMPQKRNPDPLELIRGKAAQAIAQANQSLVLQKGLPIGYQKDLQEDKPGLFALMDDTRTSIDVFRRVVATATFRPEKMAAAILTEMYATDLADILVRGGMPFRKAHEVVGTLVREAEDRGVSLGDLPAKVYREASELFPRSMKPVFTARRSLAGHDAPGGTGPTSVAAQLEAARARLDG